MIQRTLVLLKPDAIKRGIVGEILHRFERTGLKIVATKMVAVSKEIAESHYPNSVEWKTKVGSNTIDDCKKYGIDLKATIGTTDPIEVGEIVKKWNVEYLISGPILAIIFESLNSVETVRKLVGSTVPVMAPAGTIRGDFTLDSAVSANKRLRSIYNLIHASGSVEEAEEEIKLWFNPEEILEYRRIHEDLYNY